MHGTNLNTFLEQYVDQFLDDTWKKYNKKNPITSADKEAVLKSFKETLALIFKAASGNKELNTRIYKQLAIKFHPDKLDKAESERVVLFVKVLGESKVVFQAIQNVYEELDKNKNADSDIEILRNPHLTDSNIERYFFYNLNRVMSDVIAIYGNDNDAISSLIQAYINLQIILCPEIFLLQLLSLAVGAAAYGTEKLLLPDNNHKVSTELFYLSGLPSVVFANMLNITIKGTYNAVTNAPQLVNSTTQLLGENVGYIANRVGDAVSILNISGYFFRTKAKPSSENTPVLLIEDNTMKLEQDQVFQILNKAETLLSAVIYEETTYLEMLKDSVSFSFFSTQTSENVVDEKKDFLSTVLNTIKEYQKISEMIGKVKVVKQIANLMKHQVEPLLSAEGREKSSAEKNLLDFIADIAKEAESVHASVSAAASASPMKT